MVLLWLGTTRQHGDNAMTHPSGSSAHYIFVLGPYDSTLIGPFRGRFKAEVYNEKVLHECLDPNVFDTYIWTQADLDAKESEFGAIAIESPKDYCY